MSKSSSRPESNRKLQVVATFGVLVLGLGAAGAMALSTNFQSPPPVSEKVAKAFATSTALPPKPTPAPTAPRIEFGPGSKVMFVGDSWSAGTGASVHTNGYAYKLGEAMGWEVDVQAVGATGYLNPGTSGKNETYENRVQSLPDGSPDLIIVQGSVNDQNKPTFGMEEAVLAVIIELRVKYPHAQLVIFGPTPSTVPYNQNLVVMDKILQNVAKVSRTNYISPIQGQWLIADNYDELMNHQNRHPNNAGHAYLARKLRTALETIKAK